jgi:hypothetical protein
MKSHVTWVVLVPLTLVSCSQHICKPTQVTTIQYPKPLPRVATNAPMCPQFSHPDLLGFTDVCYNDVSLQATHKSLKGSFLWHAGLKGRSVNSCFQTILLHFCKIFYLWISNSIGERPCLFWSLTHSCSSNKNCQVFIAGH